MAANVPAGEVLCEATEYLTKLGSNLQARSQTLKEKKIRKDKLNNVLALQKAASKVLLICELSKKSLVNVETGVRKVLEQIESQKTSQIRKSNNNEQATDKKNESKYFYIEYQNQNLRIKNKISLKHYTSVKVLARSMPQSMINKYPVYHDCKLYRLRKKGDNSQNSVNITSESIPNNKMKINKNQSNNEENSSKCKIGQIEPVISVPNSPTAVKKIIENTEVDTSVISVFDTPLKSTNTKDRDRDQDTSPKPKTRRSSMNNDYKRNSSLDSKKESLKNRRNSENSNIRKRKMSDASDKGNSKKKFKKLRVVDDSSNEDKQDHNEKSEDKDVVDLSVSPKQEKKKPYESLDKQKNDIEDNTDSIQSTIIPLSNDAVDKDKKPLIKCVSLTKLLKPEVLVKNVIDSKKAHGSSNKEKSRESESRSKKRAEEKSSKEREEMKYWEEKHEEVCSFKPKEFVINVTRLPELSKNYLSRLCLKRITCGSKIICELENDVQDKISKLTEKEKTNRSEETLINDNKETSNRKVETKASNKSYEDSQTEEIKTSLLNDTDSDDDIITVANKVKDSLLNDSESDADFVDINQDATTKKVSDQTNTVKLRTKSDEVQNKDSLTKAKNDLLHDSESDKAYDSETNNDMKLQYEPESDNDAQENSRDEESTDRNKDNLTSEKEEENHTTQKTTENMPCDGSDGVKTPEKLFSKDDNDGDQAQDDDKSNTPLSQRRVSSLTPQSKKKRIRESMHAKKMLLTYSSSSDTEDENLKNVLKEIKASLLHGSDEERNKNKPNSNESSSSDDMIQKVKKKILEDSDEKSSKHKRKKHRKRLSSQDSEEDERPKKSRSRKMVRSKSKPGNCSSQNSDAAEPNDKDIDGLTNLNTLHKSHRRNSDASDGTEESGADKKVTRERNKPTGLICQEEMLKAESSSDAEASEDDHGAIDEELPEVTVPSFNGGVEHLVKEDLLGETESSAESHNEEPNKDDSECEEKQLNSRRKRANAISSDSEVGSSRKKDNDADVRLSDFEDSEDDASETGKRTKRKKRGSDSDGSGLSSSEGGKKKRRRIKTIRESDASGSESETEGRNKHGRKNIRKVMGKNQLEEATKKAAREEKERIARIAERQKLYNNLEFDESGKPDDVVLEKVVLDFDPETKEPLIEVDRGLVKKLKPHQANGIKFMWDACFESVKRIKKDRGSGCILAHCMGLGKTLQVVTLTHTLLTHGDLTKVNRVLVVCPLSTVLNWVNEFRMWLKHAVTDYDVEVYELSRFKQNSERAFQLNQWFVHGGVCVLGYEMFRNLSADNVKKFKKKMLKNFQESLVDPGPDLVVCDEGHLLKNEKTSLSQSMNRVKTRRRIVLTGTPLQNNLKEYYCMVQFVKPNLLGKYNEYLNRFVNPITNGQYTDSTEHDIKIMKRRSHVLHKMLDGAVQRRDYGVLAPFLPPKHEYVLFITLSEVQIKLYQYYLDNFSRKPLPGKSSGFLFPDFQSLQRIWTHPLVLKYNSERYEIMQQKKRDKEEEEDSEGSLVDFINDESTAEETTTEESTDDSSDMSDDSRKKGKKKKKSNKKSKHKEAKGDGPARPRRGTRANPVEHDDEEHQDDALEVKNENPTEWWIKLLVEDELEDMRNSHKLILLFDILRQCEAIGDKLLVFSQSLYSLDLIEHFLGKVDEATQEGRIDEKLGGHVGSWSPGVDYFRLDGSTSCENRSIWCKNFNREDNPRARLFLISTRAGGLGINLVAANRVVIFDVSWNPSHDVQSIFRVYRFGQKKPCYVYRFLAMGTMEEKIYERQVTKQAISKRVIDEQQIDRHYAENDLAELYKFEPHPPTPRPIPPLPKDRLFAEMLREHEAQIYKYHEHDSLLENKEEETLSEEERKAAWEDFENEKNRPPPSPFVSPWAMHNGMVSGLLAQQQMAAYAGLANMLRKDVPNINEEQIRTMASMLYNSNPQMFGGYDYGMMQKMNELFKYSQQGMMNPGMMNPGVMNAAGGMSGAGGSSGLQYEPPWQRQHQHQQQLRLQQLMQHQNQMGAKLYAGGLGSRDPVAMALQQQRAREMLAGGAPGAGAGRPRGRPPLQPRAPLPHDIVNLDSD